MKFVTDKVPKIEFIFVLHAKSLEIGMGPKPKVEVIIFIFSV